MGLTIMWEHPVVEPYSLIQPVDYTHLSHVRSVPAYFTIDHFVVSPQVHQAVAEANVLHCGGNPSNHSPIYLKLRVGE